MILITDVKNSLGRNILTAFVRHQQAANIRVLLENENEEDNALYDEMGVEHVLGHLNDHPSLDRAMKDVEQLLITHSNLLSDYRNGYANLVSTARGHDVKGLFFVSSINVANSECVPVSENLETETVIRQSGIPYVIFRINLLMEQIPMFLGNPLETDTFYFPAGEGRVGFVSAKDVAEATVTIHMRGQYDSRVYHLSHEKTYSFADIATMLSQISGTSVSYQHIENYIFRDVLGELNLPGSAIERLTSVATAIEQNEYDLTDFTMQQLLSGKEQKEKTRESLFSWFSGKEKEPPRVNANIRHLSEFLREAYRE